MVCAAIGLRLFFYADLYRQSPLPVEIDDSLSYLIHGAVLEQDPGFKSPLLKSFDGLSYRPAGADTETDWQINRVYHRIKEFYHTGHALIVVLLHSALGMDWIAIWWAMAVLLHCYLFLYAGLLFREVAGPAKAALALAFYSFTFIIVEHQTTAAAREWTNAGLLAVLYHVMRLDSRKLKSKSAEHTHAALLFINAFICTFSHSLGRAYLGLVLAALALKFALKRKLSRGFVLSLSVLGSMIVLLPALHPLLGVKVAPSASVQFVPASNWISHIVGFIAGFLRSLYGASFLWLTPDQNVGRFMLLVVLVGVSYGLILFVTRKGLELFRWCALGLIAQAFLFTRVGQNYQPVAEYYFFGSYLNTALFAFLTLAMVCGWLALASRVKRLKISATSVAAFAIIVLALNLYTRRENIQYHLRYLGNRSSENPKQLVELAKQRAENSGKCIVIDGEVALYFWMLYGTFELPVAFNHFNAPKQSWRSEFAGENCRIAVSANIPASKNGWLRIGRSQLLSVYERR